MKVFVDTSAFCALTIPKDQHNLNAKCISKRLQKEKAALLTSDYVLDEVYTLLKTRSGHSTAVKFMDEFCKNPISVLRIDKNIDIVAQAIFKKFDDRRLSFTDCTSFALINHSVINAVFAFDEHFRYHPYTHPVRFLE